MLATVLMSSCCSAARSSIVCVALANSANSRAQASSVAVKSSKDVGCTSSTRRAGASSRSSTAAPPLDALADVWRMASFPAAGNGAAEPWPRTALVLLLRPSEHEQEALPLQDESALILRGGFLFCLQVRRKSEAPSSALATAVLHRR